VQLDEIRGLLISERETGRLCQVPPELFEETMCELAGLESEAESENPLTDRTQLLVERISAIRETVSDLFRIRTGKVISLAYTHGLLQSGDREELKRMLPAEREMFEGIVQAIGECRLRLIRKAAEVQPGPAGSAERVSDEEIPGQPDAGSSVRAEDALVRVLSDTEPFLGVDGRIYQLRSGDVVTLPAQNASVLEERKTVVRIDRPSDRSHLQPAADQES
jgi:DNA replication factor GINS